MRVLRVGLALGAMALAASGCTSGGRAASKTAEGLPGAMSTPLNDLNITRTEIPQRLALIRSSYETLPKADCRSIAVEVVELTNILGPDTDAPPNAQDAGLKMGDDTAALILQQVTSTMADFIPFRSAVREATGASAHERRLRAAYERGVARRAYLKGVGAAKGCAPPAAPQPGAGFEVQGPAIEYRNNPQPSRSSGRQG
jgi:hypothetical protein